MKAFWDETQLAHRPQFFMLDGRVRPSLEVPERCRALLAACDRLGLERTVPPTMCRDALLAVHAADYLDFLREGPSAWAQLPEAGPEMIPATQLTPEMLANGARVPEHVTGRTAFYVTGLSTPIGAGTWPAALAAASGAVAAAEEAVHGRSAYALARPPGHHAYPARASGHCFLNNAALAAEYLIRHGAAQVGILDLDVHHGNGTQGIFWQRADVVTVSVHGDPGAQYPWFVGYAEERGAGAGAGANLNLTLARGAGDDKWIEAVAAGSRALKACDAIVIALGFDASVDDPVAFLRVTEDGFARAGEVVGRLRRPAVIVQEGGYDPTTMGHLLFRFIGASSSF